MKDLLPRIKSILHVFRYGKAINPTRDWLTIMSIFLVMILVSVVSNLWIFAKVTSGEIIGSATTTPALTPVSLERITPLFEKRKQENAHYLYDYSFIDPKGSSR